MSSSNPAFNPRGRPRRWSAADLARRAVVGGDDLVDARELWRRHGRRRYRRVLSAAKG